VSLSSADRLACNCSAQPAGGAINGVVDFCALRASIKSRPHRGRRRTQQLRATGKGRAGYPNLVSLVMSAHLRGQSDYRFGVTTATWASSLIVVTFLQPDHYGTAVNVTLSVRW